MSAVTVDPWRVAYELPDNVPEIEFNKMAVERGLHALGYIEDPAVSKYPDWPAWARYVWFASFEEEEVAFVRAVAEAGPAVQAAVEATHALGGRTAVRDYAAWVHAQGQTT
jgi:hypothetical protein